MKDFLKELEQNFLPSKTHKTASISSCFFGWTNPSEKYYIVKMGSSSPRFVVKIKTYLKPPPRYVLFYETSKSWILSTKKHPELAKNQRCTNFSPVEKKHQIPQKAHNSKMSEMRRFPKSPWITSIFETWCLMNQMISDMKKPRPLKKSVMSFHVSPPLVLL